jgi:hypothetical protein
MVAICMIINIEYFRLHNSIYPSLREERITNVIKMICCPPASIRACDLITENILSNYNPFIISSLLVSKNKFIKLSGQILRNLKYSMACNVQDRTARDIMSWQDNLLLRINSEYLENIAKINIDFFLKPQPESNLVKSYCPKCLAQFTIEYGVCSDCGSIKLLPING